MAVTEDQVRRMIEDAFRQMVLRENVRPRSLRARMLGDGVHFVRCGVAADRPSSGEIAGAVYFATDSFVLSAWTGTAWKTATLS